jgi:hypothetical protein
MTRKIYLSIVSIYIVLNGYSQFIPVEINYKVPPYSHWPEYISIGDESNVWLGTLCNGPYSFAAHTNDGGDTWLLDSIPVQGNPYVNSLFALDANTCYYVFTDNGSGGSIWKTSDGGSTWVNKTTTQFSDPGAYADFYVAFDAKEGVAVGDPTLGYFEIQRTIDGGDNWSRIDSSLIPPILPGEMGATNAFSVLGDIIWFPTLIPDDNGNYSSRCFKSVDRGQHWTVTPIVADDLGWVTIDFSTSSKGVLLDPNPHVTSGKKPFYYTSDGGDNWALDSLSLNLESYTGVSSVAGFDGGFVVGTNGPNGYSTSVFFTPDFFSTIAVLDSNLQAIPWGLKFRDAATGWLEGTGSNSNAVYKFNGLLTSISNLAKSAEKLAIIPNPTSAEALIKLPINNEQGDLSLVIYNMAGTLCEKRPVESSTGWSKLNAVSYTSGVYVVNVVSSNRLIASTKWVVQH